MPVFKVDIQVLQGTTYLTNVYHVNVADIAAADASMDDIAAIHAAGLPNVFSVVSGRVSSPAPDDGVFFTRPYNIVGSRPFTENLLPLWNRFNVTFSVGPTYLCRKFYPGVTEGDQLDGIVLTATQAAIKTLYMDPLLVLGVCCNPDGLIFSSGAVKPTVAMRQLRRRKKRTTPVIPLTA